MKNKFLFFLFLSILVMFPDNTFAKEQIPYSSNIDNTYFSSAFVYTNNVYSLDISQGSSQTISIEFSTMDYNNGNTFANFPYAVLYFDSTLDVGGFSITRTSTCNTACFNEKAMRIQKLSSYYNVNGTKLYRYVWLLPVTKYVINGVGNPQTMTEVVNDLFQFYAGTGRGYFLFYNTLITDDVSIIYNGYEDSQNIISNANQNTQSIISNQNQNTQNMITNSILNTNSIISSTVNDTNRLINNFNENSYNIIDKENRIINGLSTVDNSINDDTTDNTYQNNTLNDLNSHIASNNVISDLLLLPVTMYQKVLLSLNSNSCTTYNLGSLYGTNLTLPCIVVSNYIGSDLWTVIDLIFCGMFILVIRKKFVDIFNNMTNLKDRGNDIE